jgi:phage terminase large subunit-like protein
MEELEWNWDFWGRPDQQMPPGDWFVWLIMSGRGWGKTRTATENIARMLRGPTPLVAPPGAPAVMSIVADTPFDMRQYNIEGPSGFLHVGPPEYRPRHVSSNRTLEWPNGCKALLFSAEDPETLRGASGSFFWWDELAKARYAKEGWSNLMFGMREGNPRGIVTTTPKPKNTVLPALVKRAREGSSVIITRGSTWDNRENLSEVFYKEVVLPVSGTRLGRQEIEGEILDDVPGALWTRAMIDAARLPRALPDMQRVVVAVDPSGARDSEDDAADDIGIVVAGKGVDGRYYVLADRTCKLSPAGWGARAIKAYKEFDADRIVAERNYGGAMVENVIRNLDRKIAYTEVVASRGKVVRAEPVSALYEQGHVSHLASGLEQLEDQMCQMASDGYVGDGSPDRVDALVWALMFLHDGKTMPKITAQMIQQVRRVG